MHFITLVLVPMEHEDDPLLEMVRLLWPWTADGGHRGIECDFWQVGGRFSGWLDPEYDPREDPANQEGGELILPYPWISHAEDVLPTRLAVERLDGRLPAVIITPDGEWYGEPWLPPDATKWSPVFDEVLHQHLDTLTVVVDCHR